MSEKTESYPLALPVAESPYHTLRFFAGYGRVFAYLTGLIICAFGLALWWLGYGVGCAAAGIVLGGFACLLMNCLAELAHLIVDTMIPK